jgi:hypothetical protein
VPTEALVYISVNNIDDSGLHDYRHDQLWQAFTKTPEERARFGTVLSLAEMGGANSEALRKPIAQRRGKSVTRGLKLQRRRVGMS